MRRSAALLLTGLLAAGCAAARTSSRHGRFVHPDLRWSIDLPPGGWKAAVLDDGGVRLRRADVEGEVAVDLLPGMDLREAEWRLRRGAIESSFEDLAYPAGVRTEVWRHVFPTGAEVVAAFPDAKGRGVFVVRREDGTAHDVALAEAFDATLRVFRFDEAPFRSTRPGD